MTTCPRCGGHCEAEELATEEGELCWRRCINCGYRGDAVVLQHRRDAAMNAVKKLSGRHEKFQTAFVRIGFDR